MELHMAKQRRARSRILDRQVYYGLVSLVLGLITARLWYLEGYETAVVVIGALVMCASTFIIFTSVHHWLELWRRARRRQKVKLSDGP